MEVLYDDSFLLERIFSKLQENKSQKLIVEKPETTRQNRKTFFTNFTSFCDSVKRNHSAVEAFIKSELQVETSVMGNGILCINKIYQQQDIEKVCKNYIKSYVICSEQRCGSGNTEIIKEGRINFLVCNVCKSRKAVA